MNARAFIGAIGLAVCLPLTGSHAQEREIGGVGLTVFTDRNFRGRSATIRSDIPNLQAIGLNDSASSLRAGPGEQWEVCEHANYEGRCVVVSGSEADLRRSGWNRIISSARRLRGGGSPVAPVQPVRLGIELFSGQGYGGDRRAFTAAESDLRRFGFDDATQSLRIGPGEVWEVCADVYFGNCMQVNSDWGELSRLGMSRRISSVRPWRQSAGGSGSSGARPYIVLYDAPSYRGQAYRVDRASEVLSGFINRAESVQIRGGSWELCDRSAFNGRCVVVSGDMADLSPLGLRNRVQSVRPAVPTPR